MTLSEAFIFKSGSSVNADATLEFAGLNPTDTYDDSNKCAFYAALLNYLVQDNAGVKSESEGGYSKHYDSAGKGNYLFSLANESGCADLIDKYNPQPTVRDKSNMW